jgi:hypothetical protein
VQVNTPTFEDTVTQNRAQWLTLVRHDPIAKEFVVELTDDPERSVTQRIVRFAGVPSVEDSWVDRDDDCIETLIGAHEDEISSGIRYVLVTDQREITVVAGMKATIYNV